MTEYYMEFNELSLTPALLRAIGEAGYLVPSPIQESAIPPVLEGRDLLACAQTGTGKTAAFALPILQLLAGKTAGGKRMIRSLVLTPTRELALQIEESFTVYGKYLPLRSSVIFGGVGQNPQVAALRRGLDVLVATPGRLNDLIGQGHIDLSHVEIFVLDEADRMLDMGFVQDVKKVLKQMPQKKQTLLFSATMPDEIVKLADSLLHNPAKVFVTPVSSTVESIAQQLYKVDKVNKRFLLASLLTSGDVQSALVFTRTKHGADRVVRELTREGIQAMAIHGNKSQNARQAALSKFKEGQIKVLVATDIAARGLDINELSHVFNYDLPNIPETYVHRIGRTGRAGRGGIAISFCCFDELEFLADIQKLIGFALPEVEGHGWPMLVLQKAEKKPRQEPVSRASKAAAPGKKKLATPPIQVIKPSLLVLLPTEKPAQKSANLKARGAKNTAPHTSKQDLRPLQKNTASRNAARKPFEKHKKPFETIDPYTNLTGGKAIVTKRPVWADDATPVAPPAQQGEDIMGRNNRNRGGKNRTPQREPNLNKPAPQIAPPEIPKNENGIYDFSEAELAKDDSIKIISRTNAETKYATFEDFLKDH